MKELCHELWNYVTNVCSPLHLRLTALLPLTAEFCFEVENSPRRSQKIPRHCKPRTNLQQHSRMHKPWQICSDIQKHTCPKFTLANRLCLEHIYWLEYNEMWASDLPAQLLVKLRSRMSLSLGQFLVPLLHHFGHRRSAKILHKSGIFKFKKKECFQFTSQNSKKKLTALIVSWWVGLQASTFFSNRQPSAKEDLSFEVNKYSN